MKILLFALAVMTSSALAGPKVSLQEIVGYAAAKSNQAQMIQAAKINEKVSLLRSEAALNTKLESKLSILNDRTESAGGAFSPEKISASSLSVGATKMLATGTVFGAEISYKDTNTEYPPATGPISFTPDGKYKETTTSVFARQKLLKNAFGQSTRSQLSSAESKRQAVEPGIEGKLEDYIQGLIMQFYNVKLIQTNYRAANDRLKRQERLLKVTKIQQRRGTAEESDVLQLESAVIESKENIADIKNQLANLWRQLITSLGLPDTYLTMDPTNVDLVGENRVTAMHNHCRNGKMSPSSETKALQLQLKSLEERMRGIKSNAKPDLFVEARLSANGIDDDAGETFGESLSADHPQLTFAIGLDWSLGHYPEKADYLDALSQKAQLQANLDQVTLDAKVERINNCAKLDRDSEKVKNLQIALTKQRRRNKLEERRFELGQVPLINVIQAGNDITATEVNLQNAEISLQIAAWDVVKANGSLITYVKESVNAIAVKGNK